MVAAIGAGSMMAEIVIMVVVAMAATAMVMTVAVAAIVAVLDCRTNGFCRSRLMRKVFCQARNVFLFCQGRRPPVAQGCQNAVKVRRAAYPRFCLGRRRQLGEKRRKRY